MYSLANILNGCSGIPQGSVMGPAFFIIYIIDLSDKYSNFVIFFVDDTKIYSVVNNKTDEDILLKDLDLLIDWSDKWLLKFNETKCKHLHLGINQAKKYKLGNLEISLTENEKDLGIILDNSLKFQNYINTQAKKANSMLGIISRSFKHIDNDMFLVLYESLIRPHLEYGSQVWLTMNKKEQIIFENIQRSLATRLLPNLKKSSNTMRD